MLLLLTLAVALLAAAHCQPDTAATYVNCDRTFSCGPITNVTFPFTGGDRPSYCGLPDFALACRDGVTTELAHNSVAYRVLRLDQTQKSLVLARSDLYNNTCPSEFRNITLNTTYFSHNVPQNEDLTMFYGCNTSLLSSAVNSSNSSTELSFTRDNRFSCNSTDLNFPAGFYWIGPVPSDPILRIISCSVSVRVPMLRAIGDRLSMSRMSLEEALMQGFDVSYNVQHERLCSECNRLGGQCGFNAPMDQLICICGDDRPCPFSLTLPPAASPESTVDGSNGRNTKRSIGVALSVVGVIILCIGISCFLKRKHSTINNGQNPECEQDVKNLLQHGSLTPKRYIYSEIKKITKSFSDKLGQGGFGSVYKGTLPNGRLVAVKVLIETTDGNGEEFINEVASISRTSHVNIVSLLGFCHDRNKRAFVYEFMPNKSLDKFLTSTADAHCCLELEKLYRIAVGIAKGLEYLHTGCNTRIVHFDIKPQNILLDDDFCPKISDFGLAKLCKKQQSILSVLGTRGTIGYIAPEVFSRNFGGVSHKSDVYSYGMVLLEMAGAKRDAEAEAEENQPSENYFPDKLYEQEIIEVTGKLDDWMIEEEEERRRKMFVVGFWCIQTIPSHRPSISKVVEMLEGSLQSIQIPPKPFLFTPNLPRHEISSTISANLEIEYSALD